MASATRLPMKRIAAVGTVALTIGAWKSRPLITSFLTGPGNYSRILALLVVLANYKNFPGMWHVCGLSPFIPGSGHRGPETVSGKPKDGN